MRHYADDQKYFASGYCRVFTRAPSEHVGHLGHRAWLLHMPARGCDHSSSYHSCHHQEIRGVLSSHVQETEH